MKCQYQHEFMNMINWLLRKFILFILIIIIIIIPKITCDIWKRVNM